MITLLVYVDDIIIGGKDLRAIDNIKEQLQANFKIRDLGKLKYFLGLEIARTSQGIHVSQRKYATEIIQTAGLLGCRPAITPIEQHHKMKQNT